MRNLLMILVLLCTFAFLAAPLEAQWRCVYATYDDAADGNATGHNTASVGVISQNTFVALVMSPNVRNFMVPYVNADSALGRLYGYGYGSATAGIYQVWTDHGFDQVSMTNAAKIVATPDSVIYVANNDANHNILVFKLVSDTIDTFAPYYRQETGSNRIFGLAVDQNGYVYVSNDTTSGKTDDIKIYPPITSWTSPSTAAPLRTIDLPDGVYRGVEVSPDGSQLFVADYPNRKILRYTGSPTGGYSADASFNFQLGVTDTGTAGLPSGPINMAYLGAKNILFVAVDVHGYTSLTRDYTYGRIYLVNPFTGDLVSTDSSVCMIDAAKWNLDMTGGYSSREGGTVPGNASGYTSVYDVDLDASGYLYTLSYFGWTVDKWEYVGTLPTISNVERVDGELPQSFRLEQNYPNPFNPTTTIEFTVLTAGSVSLRVFDVLGREVVALVDRDLEPGTYRATFDAHDLTGGTYLYVFRGGGVAETKKMVLVK